MKLFGIVKGLMDRIFMLLGAVVGSQFPEFMQQYTQRLSGHAAELSQLIAKLTEMASLSNKTLDQYIYKFLSSPDPDFINQGEFMKAVVNRWQELNVSLHSLADATLWNKPYYFFKYMNYPIADTTMHSFKPGINLTVEGLCYAILGMVCAYVLYQLVIKLFYLGYTRAVSVFRSNH